MDCGKMGRLIRRLRTEQGMTQAALGARLGVCAKTISKWECGRGCPDLSLVGALARITGVDAAALLDGELRPEAKETGNMKRMQFFRCPCCGNVLTAAGAASLSCCGRPLTPLTPQKADAAHAAALTDSDGEWYVTFDHPMQKEHFIAFAAVVSWDRFLLVRLYPEQGREVRLPKLPGSKVYLCCSRDGLFQIK